VEPEPEPEPFKLLLEAEPEMLHKSKELPKHWYIAGHQK
jgi:hypothetical protein